MSKFAPAALGLAVSVAGSFIITSLGIPNGASIALCFIWGVTCGLVSASYVD